MGNDIRFFIDEIGQYAAITELDEVISAHSQGCGGRKAGYIWRENTTS